MFQIGDNKQGVGKASTDSLYINTIYTDTMTIYNKTI